MVEQSSWFRELIHSYLPWFWFVVIGGLSGMANYFSGIRQNKFKFAFVDFAMDVFISAFVSIITGLTCLSFDLSIQLSLAIAGVVGHMGTRALILAEHYFRNRVDKLSK